ncbi:hypothetical protein OV203_47620 [Nannocystis sp. ILAH1]|uniref:hypothetical protein n=1 Tax=unclassified Nannocystis TaxID=2627009 RepID=UPI00226FB70E|nr:MULTISPECIES: hypothetical protein [unclassified Nannocystis]MCY0994889.1 hypothetical protein [Nannocystis sp. ILAH1]MCY1065282.1 hypothetical protein [Nannocystis sp. RBIL2]
MSEGTCDEVAAERLAHVPNDTDTLRPAPQLAALEPREIERDRHRKAHSHSPARRRRAAVTGPHRPGRELQDEQRLEQRRYGAADDDGRQPVPATSQSSLRICLRPKRSAQKEVQISPETGELIHPSEDSISRRRKRKAPPGREGA